MSEKKMGARLVVIHLIGERLEKADGISALNCERFHKTAVGNINLFSLTTFSFPLPILTTDLPKILFFLSTNVMEIWFFLWNLDSLRWNLDEFSSENDGMLFLLWTLVWYYTVVERMFSKISTRTQQNPLFMLQLFLE